MFDAVDQDECLDDRINEFAAIVGLDEARRAEVTNDLPEYRSNRRSLFVGKSA